MSELHAIYVNFMLANYCQYYAHTVTRIIATEQ